MTEQSDIPSPEVHQFDADISQVMSIIVNSLYSNKEIFLRELVSNACDALSKRRFASLTTPDDLTPENLKVCIRANDEDHTLTIQDTGIGMGKEELVSLLGTIANSGTRKFQAAKEDMDLIGQFGVGFYSAFLVADTVEVFSRGMQDQTVHRWSSSINPKESGTFLRDPK